MCVSVCLSDSSSGYYDLFAVDHRQTNRSGFFFLLIFSEACDGKLSGISDCLLGLVPEFESSYEK